MRNLSSTVPTTLYVQYCNDSEVSYYCKISRDPSSIEAVAHVYPTHLLALQDIETD